MTPTAVAEISADAFDEQVFLAEFWQQKPLLIRGALSPFRSPISPEKLAGLALEAEIESRIIGHADGVWSLETGPFTERDFHREDAWTLLVQGVDQLIDDVANLRSLVDFLPSWRFDDVMVSYAVDGGGVGPHFDRYDVFLLQGMGERLWRVGEACDESTPRINHNALQLLEQFNTVDEYLLSAGDMLYVPPGVAHWGIAQGDCVTYSLGFRAPKVSDLLARVSDEVLPLIDDQCLLEDRSAIAPGRPGEITQAQIDNARAAAINALEALDSGAWLGELVTESGAAAEFIDTTGVLLPGEVALELGARVAWIAGADDCSVFANGDRYSCPASLIPCIELLCSGGSIDPDLDCEDTGMLLDFLLAAGALRNID